MKKCFVAAALIMTSQFASAENWSIGIGANNLNDSDLSVTSAALTVDYQASEFWGVVAEVAGGGSDTYGIGKIDLDSYVSLKGRIGGTHNDTFYYVSFGAYDVSGTGSACFRGFCGAASDSGSGTLYGVGFKHMFTESWGVDMSIDRTFGDLEDTNSVNVFLKYSF